jgi:signal transduction histidine kinase
VKKQNGQASKNAIPFERNGTVTYISIDAIPLSNTIEPYYLVIFQESQSVTEKRVPGKLMRSNNKRQTLSNKEELDARDIRIHHLEQELAQTHEDMRTITDDQEATNEELQSDNEELSSSSEELQSLNEELETSKEELQSSNEELLIVNQEMVSLNNLMEEKVQHRTRELSVANELLERKNEELQSMNKELNSVTYVASHDLQEPLRKIQLFARLLRETENQNLTDRGKDYFVRVQSAAHRMQTLIQNLLTFSRISKGERKFENVNPSQIIEEVKSELSETIREKNAIIEINAHCTVYIIPFQFQQMMFNLLGNALKFSKPDVPPHITIECKNMIADKANNTGLAPGKEYCHVSIRDNGIGFESKYKEKIFDLFQRLHGKDRYEGTGIGLSIVKKVVEIHNGHIFSTSQLNEGTTFNIYIPVEPATSSHSRATS